VGIKLILRQIESKIINGNTIPFSFVKLHRAAKKLIEKRSFYKEKIEKVSLK